ncbi:MAG: GIY-YIG nuclease family protein [Agitococcus sp.]|nr:GIY-YIG nuclease family protein [Agitococcus sp.]MDO9177043.1 GIY-YIG nuclease family protein [Agitococcus sp.]
MDITQSHLTMQRLYTAFLQQDPFRYANILTHAIRQGAVGFSEVINEHVLGDDWLDFTHQAMAQYWATRRGIVYVVTNPVHYDCFKVGKSTQSMTQRLKQLNNEAVVGTFIPVHHWAVHDCHFLERDAHRVLRPYHVQKEFFKEKYSFICEKITQVIADDTLRFSAVGLGPSC